MPERKQALPPFPQVVGIVTSPQAAALRDVLNVLRRRYPLVQVLLAPTLVQGEMAPSQIVAALADPRRPRRCGPDPPGPRWGLVGGALGVQ